jgi:hypothetical protein
MDIGKYHGRAVTILAESLDKHFGLFEVPGALSRAGALRAWIDGSCAGQGVVMVPRAEVERMERMLGIAEEAETKVAAKRERRRKAVAGAVAEKDAGRRKAKKTTLAARIEKAFAAQASAMTDGRPRGASSTSRRHERPQAAGGRE